MTGRCLCGILPIQTGAYIVALIDMMLTCVVLPTIAFNAYLFLDNRRGGKDSDDNTLYDVYAIVTLVSLVLIILAKCFVLVYLLYGGIRRENESYCKPWFWLNTVLLWCLVVSGFASAVVAGIHQWIMFPIMLFILAFVTAICAYLIFVIYSYMKSLR